MAVLKNCELYWLKLDPKNPVSPFGEPVWETQIRTSNEDQAKSWEEKNLAVKKSKGDDRYWFVNLKRKAVYEKTGDAAQPVVVVDGELMPIDSTSVGNGSIGNVQLFQKNWEMNGRKGVKSELKAIQVTKLVVYKAQGGLAFEATGKTEVISSGEGPTADDASDLWD